MPLWGLHPHPCPLQVGLCPVSCRSKPWRGGGSREDIAQVPCTKALPAPVPAVPCVMGAFLTSRTSKVLCSCVYVLPEPQTEAKPSAVRAQSPPQPQSPARDSSTANTAASVPGKLQGWECPSPQPGTAHTSSSPLGMQTHVHIVTLGPNRVESLKIKIFFSGKWLVIKTETFRGSGLDAVASAGDGLSRERQHHPSPACSLVMSCGARSGFESDLGQKTVFSHLTKVLSKSTG